MIFWGVFVSAEEMFFACVCIIALVYLAIRLGGEGPWPFSGS